jgi:hypothetical protein
VGALELIVFWLLLVECDGLLLLNVLRVVDSDGLSKRRNNGKMLRGFISLTEASLGFWGAISVLYTSRVMWCSSKNRF